MAEVQDLFKTGVGIAQRQVALARLTITKQSADGWIGSANTSFELIDIL